VCAARRSLVRWRVTYLHADANAPSLAWNRGGALQNMLMRKVFCRDVRQRQRFLPMAQRLKDDALRLASHCAAGDVGLCCECRRGIACRRT
jgi:hypothetical protein